jgi:trehalose utilization protein
MGTACNLKWREDGDKERLWIVDPSHPIVQGVGDYILIPNEETYCEPFGIPEPDKLIMIGAYDGGEVFRSGCCWYRGYGKIFYFQPGHETYPVYRIPEIQTIIKNAVRWCEPTRHVNRDALSCPNIRKLKD